MRWLRIVGGVVLVVAAVFAVALMLGAMQPVAHTATASAIVNAPQSVVWQRIEDVATQSTWRTGLTSVDLLPPEAGHPCWMENQKYGKMPLCEDAAQAPTMRIVRIADPKLPFGGIWTYVLTPLDTNSTRVSITENGTTGPWIWRFAGHYIFHEDTMIKQYEADLQKSVGQKP